ncbi:hypothetical protein [Paenibacillus eucommiae]|uniref:Uncharacterized protein n=1 Tax=Paenibacillus eucommiae TaxID=1355755 RepID=A0ABS4J6U6_9BACL|nr:hypothetical protein [Paenibacillus eucommiae]MBP1995518.1 hypothetical protein [Paenibacillus eucommiae]
MKDAREVVCEALQFGFPLISETFPLRIFSEAMGANVNYENASNQTNGVNKIDNLPSSVE